MAHKLAHSPPVTHPHFLIHLQGGTGWGTVVRTEAELVKAIEQARGHDGVCLIECMLDRDDCTKELLEWGTRVAAANGRKHKEF